MRQVRVDSDRFRVMIDNDQHAIQPKQQVNRACGAAPQRAFEDDVVGPCVPQTTGDDTRSAPTSTPEMHVQLYTTIVLCYAKQM